MYKIIKFFLSPFIKFFWIKKVKGLDKNIFNQPLIIAANHQSYFDFLCLIAISPKPIYFLAGEVFFEKPYWRSLMRLTKQIKVDRYSKDKSESLDVAARYLEEGKIIGIFPEGTRSKDGKIGKTYTGVVKLARRTGSKVLPVGIQGTYEIMSRFDKKPKLKKICQLNFGSLIDVKANKLMSDSEILENLIMKSVRNLCGQQK